MHLDMLDIIMSKFGRRHTAAPMRWLKSNLQWENTWQSARIPSSATSFIEQKRRAAIHGIERCRNRVAWMSHSADLNALLFAGSDGSESSQW